MNARDVPNREKVLDARRCIAPYVHHTPVLTCKALDALTGSRLFFKCENFQKGGAFKVRGALHAVLTLPGSLAGNGVATHSSGNHAQALSIAAALRGIKAYVVMPENAPKNKVEAVKEYGGDIRFCYPALSAREATLLEVLDEHGAVEIHPYNDYRIIAGQATVAAEFFETITHADCLVAPVGGGGLLSGTILGSRFFSPDTKVYGAEPEKANDAWQSFRHKRLIPVSNPQTVADGLRTSLGSLTFPIIRDGAANILTTSEESIVRAMLLLWERMKIVTEPSGAVPLAAILDHPRYFAGKRVGVILSGGNANLFQLPWMEQQLNNQSISRS